MYIFSNFAAVPDDENTVLSGTEDCTHSSEDSGPSLAPQLIRYESMLHILTNRQWYKAYVYIL